MVTATLSFYEANADVKFGWSLVVQNLERPEDNDSLKKALKTQKEALRILKLQHKNKAHEEPQSPWYLSTWFTYGIFAAGAIVTVVGGIGAASDGLWQNKNDCNRPTYIIVLITVGAVALTIFPILKGVHSKIKNGYKKKEEEKIKKEMENAETISKLIKALSRLRKQKENQYLIIQQCVQLLKSLPQNYCLFHPEMAEFIGYLIQLLPAEDPARQILEKMRNIHIKKRGFLDTAQLDQGSKESLLQPIEKIQSEDKDISTLWNELDKVLGMHLDKIIYEKANLQRPLEILVQAPPD